MDFSEISPDVQSYIPLTEDEYNALPSAARQILLEHARDRYREAIVDGEDPEKEEFPIGDFTITVEEKNERVRLRGKKYKWRRRDVIGVAETPIILTPNNVEDFGRCLDELRDRYTTDDFVPYQYTISANDNHENTSPNSSHLISIIQFRLEEYEDGRYVVQGFTIRFKKGYQHEEHQGGINAGRGEGIPREIGDGYWSLDIIQAKNKCIPNAYVLWKMYKDGCVDQVIQGDRKEFMRRRRPLITGDNIKFRDVMGEGEKFGVIYHDEDVKQILPGQTERYCLFTYLNGHVGLLVHERYLNEKSILALKKLSKRTVLHKILPKNKDPAPIKIVVADIESFRKRDKSEKGVVHDHVPLLVGQYNGKKFKYFRGDDALEQYAKYLSDSDKDWLIWFHNGALYDVHLLLVPMSKYCDTSLDLPMGIRDLRGSLLEITVHLRNGHMVTFRDSYALIPESLAKLSKDMNVTRKMEDVDIKNVPRDDFLNSPKILEYNKLDCVSLHEVLTKYQSSSTKTFQTNPLHHVSASSFAKRIFFSEYYDEERYPLYVLPKHVRDFISEAYCGGRNEVFRRGRFRGEPIFVYDFKAFYPSVGREPLPYNIPRWKDKLENIKGTNAMRKFLEDNPGFYEVEILSSPRDKIPSHGTLYDYKYIFPYFVNYEGKRFFSPELIHGLDRGYRYRLLRGYSQPLAPICAKFFEGMINVRTEAEREKRSALAQAAKTTAVSGYGYFGFNPYDRNIIKVYGEGMYEHLESLAHDGRLSYRKEGDMYVCYERANVLLSDINVSVAAAITSYARIKLCDLLQDIVDAGGIIYYCDTDSVYCSIDIVKHKTLSPKWCGPGKGKNLGELKRELPMGEDIEDITFIGCKTYGFKTNKGKYHVKSKGTNNPKPMEKPVKGSEKYEDPHESYTKDMKEYKRNIEAYDKLCGLLDGPQVYETETISRSRVRKVQKDMKVCDRMVPKIIKGTYTKGHVLDNGEVLQRVLTTRIPKEDPGMDDFIVRQYNKM